MRPAVFSGRVSRENIESERSRSLVSRAWDPLPFVLVADSRGAEMERHFRAHCPRRHLKGPRVV